MFCFCFWIIFCLIVIKFSFRLKFNCAKFWINYSCLYFSTRKNSSIIIFLYSFNNFKFFFILDFVQINTLTLEPSLIGLITTGNFNFFSICFIIDKIFLSNEYSINLGVKILFLINIFLWKDLVHCNRWSYYTRVGVWYICGF